MRHFLLFALLFFAVAQASAIERIGFSLASLSGAGLQAEGLQLVLMPGADGTLGFTAQAKRLVLGDGGEQLHDVELHCADLRLSSDAVRCEQGRAHIKHAWLQRPALRFSFEWDKPSARLELHLQSVAALGGQWTLDYRGDENRHHLSANAKTVSLARLHAELLKWVPALRDMELSGKADVAAELTLDAQGVRDADWDLRFVEAAFSDAEGQFMAEALTARLTGRSSRQAGAKQQAKLKLDLSAGALLTPYAYIEPKAKPITLQGELEYEFGQQRLAVEKLHYHHPGVMEFTADAQLALDPVELRSLKLDTGQIAAQSVYLEYLQPVLSGTLLEQVAWRGEIQAKASLTAKDGARLSMDLSNLSLRDRLGDSADADAKPRFELDNLTGRVNWSERGAPSLTRLHWRGGAFLGALQFGEANLSGELQGQRFTLLKPLELPLLDGSLMLDRLQIRDAGGSSPAFEFDGILTPISLERLSDALGWPPLAGSVSGVIPGLSLRDGRLAVDGNLLIRVFDGNILIRDLSLDGLLGYLPALRADVQLRGLDLETLTGAFSFGKITGKLDGRIEALYLEGWQPISFDAAFATPADDNSPHYISQRAVDNISNLGGAGIGGSLSRTFLGMFEEFRYERLGISCLLRDGVCNMGGVAPGEPGYYLVVGSGIPQINIKGFNSQTDWTRLVRQLQQISAGGDPVIELNAE